VPPHLAAATAKSLEKLPADRFESAAKFAEALHDPHFTVSSAAASPEAVEGPRAWNAREMVGWAVAAVLALLLGWMIFRPAPTATPPTPMRFTLNMIDFDGLRLGEIAVSPDGALFALPDFNGIHIRRADDASYRLLPHIRAISPVFSPDGKWLVYTRDGVLFKVPVEGGVPQTLVRSNTLGASDPDWGYAGTIVFTSQRTLYRVADSGGEPEVIVEGVYGVRPKLLPDGTGVLFSVPAGIMLFEFGADSARLIVPGGTDATYVETGHLVYGLPDEGGLLAVPFDLRSHEVTGPSVPVGDDVTVNGTNAFYSISRTGTLVYPTNPLAGGGARQLLLLDLRGGIDTIPLAPRSFNWPRFSPDGRLLAFNTGSGRTEQRALYTYDLESGTTTQITFEGGAHAAAWSTDGTRLVFSSEREGTVAEDLFITPADGRSPPTRIFGLPSDEHAMAWPTDDQIVFTAAPEGNQDLLIVDPTTSGRQATPYLNAEWNESELSISPDGELAVYESDESGRAEIYGRRFPEPRDQRRISAAGGRSPRWAPDGETVYYWSLTGDTLFAAPLEMRRPAAEIVAVVPRRTAGWDIDRVSGRAVVTQAVEETADTSPEIVVVVNWFEELKAKVGNE
jgi:Tol biopolymer transport system component